MKPIVLAYITFVLLSSQIFLFISADINQTKCGVNVVLPSCFSVGWIGNDAITPIIGEHDPYIHIYGRVRIVVPKLVYIHSMISPSPSALTTLSCKSYKQISVSGADSSTYCHYPYDFYHGCCHSYINRYCSAHPYGNFCP